MDKKELLSQLNNAQNNFMLGIASLGLLTQEESFLVLENLVCILTETFVSFTSDISQLHNQFQNVQFPIKCSVYKLIDAGNKIKTSSDEELQKIKEEFFKMLERAFLKESFEVIKTYCKKSEQFHLFQQQSWYHFARIIRNCLSHDFLINYTSQDEKLLPISWKQKSFTLEMSGQPLLMNFLGINDTFDLYKEMRKFADNLS